MSKNSTATQRVAIVIECLNRIFSEQTQNGEKPIDYGDRQKLVFDKLKHYIPVGWWSGDVGSVIDDAQHNGKLVEVNGYVIFAEEGVENTEDAALFVASHGVAAGDLQGLKLQFNS